MDNWFLELLNIINRQSEERKVEMLLPELYSEFDILARNFDGASLKELYEFINTNNPIHTTDKEYNQISLEKLKRNLLKRMVMIDDLSIIEQELLILISNKKRKASKEYVKSWKDYTYVHERLLDLFTSSYSSSRPAKKTVKPDIEPEPEVKDLVIEESIVEETPLQGEFEEIKDNEATEEDVFESVIESKPDPEPIPEPIVVEEPEIVEETIKPEIDEDVISEPEDIQEPVEDPEPVVEEEPEPIIKKNPKKNIPSKPVIALDVSIPKTTDRNETTNDPNLFFDFLDVVTVKYPIIINIEALRRLSNPKPSFYRMFVGFIDENERDEDFFIELINYLFEFDLYDFVTYITDKSIRLRKLCIYNIGLLNIKNTTKKFKLIFLLSQENTDYIKNSLLERELRVYIDSLTMADDTTDELYHNCEAITQIAPKQIDTTTAIDSISYFKNHVLNTHDPIIDENNPTHLYWAIILSACLCIYVAREKDYTFTGSMDFVAKKAVRLIEVIEDETQKINVQRLAIDYIRRVYKAGEKSPNYVKWWDRQRDDFFDQKLSAIQTIRSAN